MIASALKPRVSVVVQSGFPRWKKQTMSCMHSAPKNIPTAGIIVIGDEILKGQVRDSNSHFITSRLYSIGVRVMKVSVVGDDVNEISNEVRKFSCLYTYVITSGGIGPTHDDVTFEGVAKAFDENTYPHPELVKICSEFYNTTDLSSPAMKLASVPKSARLKYGFDHIQNRKSKFPNISVKNVYIFPGVPPLLEKSFTMLCEDLFGGSGCKFFKSDLYIDESEVLIAENLSRAVEEFPSVSFGSYPQYGNSYYHIKISVEANNPELLWKAVHRLKELLPAKCLVDFDPEPLQSSYEKIKSLGEQTGMNHVLGALEDVLQSLNKFGMGNLALCIDSSLRGIATTHLLYAALKKLQRVDPVSAVFLKSKENTTSDIFREDFVSRYLLRVEEASDELNMALSTLHATQPHLKVLIVGCQCSNTNFEEALHSLYGDDNVYLLSPLSSWSEAQTLEFVRKLSLVYAENTSIANVK